MALSHQDPRTQPICITSEQIRGHRPPLTLLDRCGLAADSRGRVGQQRLDNRGHRFPLSVMEMQLPEDSGNPASERQQGQAGHHGD